MRGAESKKNRAVSRPVFGAGAGVLPGGDLLGSFRLDFARGFPGDREAVALLVRELVFSVEVVRAVGQVEAVIRVREPVLEVLDSGGVRLVGPERLVEMDGREAARQLRVGGLRAVVEGNRVFARFELPPLDGENRIQDRADGVALLGSGGRGDGG